jgi:hypothetical protein
MKNLTFLPAAIFLYVFMSPISSIAQGNIEGIVLDEFNNEPIPFTNIHLLENDSIILSTTTFEEGDFYFDNVPNGDYKIKIESFGKSQIYSNIKISNEILILNLAFDPSIIGGGGEVIWHNGLFTKEYIKTYDTELIENLGITNIIEIESIGTGTVETDQGISYKGARPGTAVYYIDGVRTYNDLYIPMSSVGRIEVYNGGVPAQYGNTTSAVIVIETKSYFDKF